MNFNSLEFLLFLPTVLLLYHLLPKRFQWVMLLGASYLFYMSFHVWMVWLIFLTTAVSYGAAILMERFPNKKKALLAGTLFLCLGLLFYFKYFDFTVNSILHMVNILSGRSFSFTADILLPAGISFYTFQTLSYVIDVYRGDYPAEKHFGYYALFVSYFPQLVAGPIENPGSLLPQLKSDAKPDAADRLIGLRILLCGFFKKCVVADVFGIYVNRIFASLENASGPVILFAGFLFYIQMYGDFAGYSEIASGSARMMGIKLTRNFNRPYLSASYTEFFRRWHISLNRWFTSYVYIPLGGNRKGTAKKLRNILIVFLLCGLWHGANWTYVLWGLYAAVFLCLEELLKKPLERLPKTPWITTIRRCLMLFIFIPAALIFRSPAIADIHLLFSRIFTKWSIEETFTSFSSIFSGIPALLGLALRMAALLFVDRFSFEEKRLADAPAFAINTCLMLAVALSWISLLADGADSAFAYFQF